MKYKKYIVICARALEYKVLFGNIAEKCPIKDVVETLRAYCSNQGFTFVEFFDDKNENFRHFKFPANAPKLTCGQNLTKQTK